MTERNGSEREQWVVLARVLRPQGRRGEVMAELMTDFPERLAGRTGLHLIAGDEAAGEPAAWPCELVRSWLPKGKNEGRVVLEIAGVDSIERAEALAGMELAVREGQRLPLEDGAAYISDLVGCVVMDGDRRVGTVRDVQFPMAADGRRRLENGAPLLVVDDDSGAEVLVPFVTEFEPRVEIEARVIRMRLPAGLLELNEDEAAGG